MRRVLVPALVALAGCGVDPAPAGIDDLSRWLWLNYEAATDEDMAGAAVKLHAEMKDMPADDDDRGDLTRLSKADLELVGLEGNDPAKARGLFVATVIPCPLAKVEPLIYALNQDELHPDSYDAYKRTYTSDLGAYQSRAEPFLTWETEITATPVTVAYSEKLRGGVRWVPESPHGPVLLSRTWLPSPATFPGEDPEDYFFRQDYQIEMYYERAPGETVHLFAVWREMKYGSFDTEGGSLANIQMDGFVDWDEAIAERCAK